MKRQDIFCDYCESESTVETSNMEEPILFCPICGTEVSTDEEIDSDFVDEEESW
jgi:uncharacterized Zn finger protein (UPF0148 family)